MNSTAIIDNKIGVELPEGVSLTLVPAGIAVRTAAFFIDFIFRALIFIAAALVLSQIGQAGEGILLVTLFILNWCYYIFFEYRSGASPGKRRMNLKVVADNGLPAGFTAILLRNLLRPVDMFPIGYALGLLSMILSQNFKRLGDWAGGTMVVYKQQIQSLPKTSGQALTQAPQPLATSEQAVILDFWLRHGSLSVQRQQELAELVINALDIETDDPVAYLCALGAYYAGEKV
ncbi:Uncharacterized membrane protein YckC, RDD family [Arsukibacterium tuosuense]|uniref:Uncharacterized membrane protein YckC, RDD family n=1 Tax=Arsukibacterium tuosuense TaxID=1323745 RepID=A0A285I9R1_9GAMM|nr:RDD family protein [Arsukibacterium tuosuense]SNY44705.1 Uncharacterized membrane protein YckC, RDD family [Arsukibacterium tuosuense]